MRNKSIKYTLPTSVEGQREGDRQRVETDPKVKINVGSLYKSDFNATVTNANGEDLRPLYSTPGDGETGSGANPGDIVTVSPGEKSGDGSLGSAELALEQNRRMESLTLSVVNERERQVAVHKRKLFGFITVYKKEGLVPEGRNPR